MAFLNSSKLLNFLPRNLLATCSGIGAPFSLLASLSHLSPTFLPFPVAVPGFLRFSSFSFLSFAFFSLASAFFFFYKAMPSFLSASLIAFSASKSRSFANVKRSTIDS